MKKSSDVKKSIEECKQLSVCAEKIVSRKVFLSRTGKMIVLGTVAHFVLIGGASTALAEEPCSDPKSPLYVPGMCTNSNPENKPPVTCGWLAYTLCVITLQHSSTQEP